MIELAICGRIPMCRSKDLAFNFSCELKVGINMFERLYTGFFIFVKHDGFDVKSFMPE